MNQFLCSNPLFLIASRGVYFYLFGYKHSGIDTEILVSYGKFSIFAHQIHTKYLSNFQQKLYFYGINDRYKIDFATVFWVFLSLDLDVSIWKWITLVLIDTSKELDCQTIFLHIILKAQSFSEVSLFMTLSSKVLERFSVFWCLNPPKGI